MIFLLVIFTSLSMVAYSLYILFFGQPKFAISSSDLFLLGAYIATVVSLHVQLFIAFRRDADLLQRGGGPDPDSQRRARWVARGVMSLVLFPASIHGFTHVVYPWIPVERGGGNYWTGQVVDVCLRPSADMFAIGSSQDIPQRMVKTDYCPSGLIIGRAVVLEEEPETIYLASVYDQGASSDTRSGDQGKCGVRKWHQSINSPKVIAVNTAAIIDVRDVDTVKHFCTSKADVTGTEGTGQSSGWKHPPSKGDPTNP